ncbi:MAG TPA: hypothetical protein VFG41_01500 [Sphingomicrobium sp.]|nr:hypothetical protein [Sphingomicrobium sp.]
MSIVITIADAIKARRGGPGLRSGRSTANHETVAAMNATTIRLSATVVGGVSP